MVGKDTIIKNSILTPIVDEKEVLNILEDWMTRVTINDKYLEEFVLDKVS